MTWSTEDILSAVAQLGQNGAQALEQVAYGEVMLPVDGDTSHVWDWMTRTGLVTHSDGRWRITPKGLAVLRLRHLAERLALSEAHR